MDSNSYILLLPILLPIAAAVLVALIPFQERRRMRAFLFLVFALEVCVCIGLFVSGEERSLYVMQIAEGLELYLNTDLMSRTFLAFLSVTWLLDGIFAFEYMAEDEREKLYYCVYLIVCGIIAGLAMSGNLITYYVFYEFMSLSATLLVLHNRRHESIMAALKFLFYSIAGALMVLFGVFVMLHTLGGDGLVFTPGGLLAGEEQTPVLLVAVFFMVLGFGTKAGMFPMHAWLPAAHPVAPAPASAVLSGIITKTGVLGIIRAVYFVAGADFIRGTWVQVVWIILALVTVFMGSMLAYKEKLLKKRLAYSTVSQVSYIMFGLSLLTPTAFVGAALHIIFHSLAKNALFLSAGAIIHKTGKTRVDELSGIGKQMPVVMWCFTLASLSLIGIPPLCAFVSKWYLAVGALESGLDPVTWLGPVILLVSALLTAGYLLPVSIKGFFPQQEPAAVEWESKEPTWRMLLPLIVLSAFSILFGIWPGALVNLFSGIAAAVL